MEAAQPDDALKNAACVGDTAAVAAAIQAGADANHLSPRGFAAIHLAARRGHFNVISLLLGAQADVNLVRVIPHGFPQPPPTELNFTALNFACKHAHLQTVQVLLAAGARFSATVGPAIGQTIPDFFVWPLDSAVDARGVPVESVVAVVQALLDAGAGPAHVEHCRHSGWMYSVNPLIEASTFNNAELVNTLINVGFPLELASMAEGRTALGNAIEHGCLVAAAALIANGAKPNNGTAAEITGYEDHVADGVGFVDTPLEIAVSSRLESDNPEDDEHPSLLQVANFLFDNGARVERCQHEDTLLIKDTLLMGSADLLGLLLMKFPPFAASPLPPARQLSSRDCLPLHAACVLAYFAARQPEPEAAFAGVTLDRIGCVRTLLRSLRAVDLDVLGHLHRTDLDELWERSRGVVTTQQAQSHSPLPADDPVFGGMAATGQVTPVQLARRIASMAPVNQARGARLILDAAGPWSPSSHDLFPDATRARAVELLRLGYLLANTAAIGEEQGFTTAWTHFVMPYALDRDTL